MVTEKDAQGFGFKDADQDQARPARWAAIGKAFTPRPINKSSLEKSMARACGLHREAQFKIIGRNLFLMNFGSEGDWRHVLNNGPWQFDFSVLIFKEYEGNIRPSEMVFEDIDI